MSIRELREAVEKVAIDCELQMGAGGTIYDRLGRVICTVNIKDLTLPEAWVYAKLFHFAATNCDAILRALEEEGRDG